MSDGYTHTVYWKRGMFFFFPANLAIVYINPIAGVSSYFGYLFHYYSDNDDDLPGVSKADGRTMNIPVIGPFLFGIKSMYGGDNRKRHRKARTHIPFYATAFRLIFYFWWILPLLIYLNMFHGFQFDWWQLQIIGGFWFGLSEADSIHYMLDVLDVPSIPENKRTNKSRKK